MERRDRIVLQKVLSEIGIAQEMMGNCTVEQFTDEKKIRIATPVTSVTGSQ